MSVLNYMLKVTKLVEEGINVLMKFGNIVEEILKVIKKSTKELLNIIFLC